MGGEGGFGVMLFASGLSPTLGDTPRGSCFGKALPPTPSSSPRSLMVFLRWRR